MHATFKTGDFMSGLRFVNQVAELAEVANHHPDIVLKYGAVEVLLISHDVGSVTERDRKLDAQIDLVADGLGISAAG